MERERGARAAQLAEELAHRCYRQALEAEAVGDPLVALAYELDADRYRREANVLRWAARPDDDTVARAARRRGDDVVVLP